MMKENQFKDIIGNSVVRCQQLFAAKYYKNASTLCPDTKVSCAICPINLALQANPNLTFLGLQKAVADLENKN